MKLIEKNQKSINALCKKHKVCRMFVFGSILTNRFNDESDVDLLVNFNKSEVEDYFNNFFDLKYALQDLLGSNVDLVEGQTIKNHYLKQSIDASKTLVYG